MRKSEIFDILVGKVCDICEVDSSAIIRCRKVQSVVDARLLAVQYLRRIGLSDDDIALIVLHKLGIEHPTEEEIKRKAKGVAKMFASYSERCLQSYAFCLMSVDIKKFCHERYKDLYCGGMKQLPD